MAKVKVWANTDRLMPDMMAIDVITGVQLPAGQMFSNLDVFPKFEPPVVRKGQGQHQIQSYVHEGAANVTASAPRVAPASLGPRFLATLFDCVLAIPLVVMSALPVIGILGAPLLCLYWLSRDSLFKGQSLGKRLMHIRVVREDNQPFLWSNSATRNIIYLCVLLMALPVIGDVIEIYAIGPLTVLEIILVLTTRKRLGDHIGRTAVMAD